MIEAPPPKLAQDLYAMKLEQDRQRSINQDKDHESSKNIP